MLFVEYLNIDGDKCSYVPLFPMDDSLSNSLLNGICIAKVESDGIDWETLGDSAKVSLDVLRPYQVLPEDLEKAGIDFYHSMPEGFINGRDILTKDPFAAPSVFQSHLKSLSNNKRSVFVLVADSQDIERNTEFYMRLLNFLKFDGNNYQDLFYKDLYKLLLKGNSKWKKPNDAHYEDLTSALSFILSNPSLFSGKEKDLNDIFKNNGINISVSRNKDDEYKVNFIIGNVDEMRSLFNLLKLKDISLPGYYKYALSEADIFKDSIYVNSFPLYRLSKIQNNKDVAFLCEFIERYCYAKGINPGLVRVLKPW